MTFEQRYISCLNRHGFHRLAYTQWGKAASRDAALCVHGLTRNSRDFDALAQALAKDRLVACPDVAGRGLSDWLVNPEDYGYPLYMADMAALIARLDVDEVDLIGTSLGGLIGMMLAALPNSPIRKLVINDVGPFIPASALARIGTYLGQSPQFDDLAQAEAYLRKIHAPFGSLSDDQWAHLTRHSVRRGKTGGHVLHYDPAIAKALVKSPPEDMNLWPVWERISCPVLILRGAQSDLLSKDTAERMLTDGPAADLVEIPDVGHAPTLMTDSQIKVILDWL